MKLPLIIFIFNDLFYLLDII